MLSAGRSLLRTGQKRNNLSYTLTNLARRTRPTQLENTMSKLEDRAGLIDYLAQTDTDNAEMEDLIYMYYEELTRRYELMSDDQILEYLKEEEDCYEVPASLTTLSEEK